MEAAVGLDETRGDTLTLAEMPFGPLPTALPATTPPIWSNLDLTQLIQIAVAGIVSLILGLFVVRPLLLAPPRPAPIGSDLTRMPQEQATPAQQIESQSEEEQEDPIERLRRKVAGRQDEALRILQPWAEGGPAQEARSE